MSLPRVSTAVLASLLLAAIAGPAAGEPIDLNDFFSWPGSPVTVAADGSSATIGESPTLNPVTLSNNPVWDPNVIIPGPGTILVFRYDFVEAAGNTDEFRAFVIDASTGASAGAAFEFLTQSTSSGSVRFPLESLTGMSLGLEFQLNRLDGVIASQVIVSDVALIPEPTAALLFLTVLPLVLLRARKARRTG